MAALLVHMLCKSENQFVFEVDPSIADTMQKLNNYDYLEHYDLTQNISEFKSEIEFVSYK